MRIEELPNCVRHQWDWFSLLLAREEKSEVLAYQLLVKSLVRGGEVRVRRSNEKSLPTSVGRLITGGSSQGGSQLRVHDLHIG